MDFALPARPVRLSLIAGRGHYDRIFTALRAARTSVWIATANLKELLIEDPRATGRARARFHSVLEVMSTLAARGVELRILHAGAPSGPFRASFDRRPSSPTSAAPTGPARASAPRARAAATSSSA